MGIFDMFKGSGWAEDKVGRQAREQLEDAASYFLKHEPFFAHMLYSLRWIGEMPPGCPQTMGVDGINLFYSPAFVLSLTPEERRGLLAHEMQHIAWDHINRIGDRKPEKWNIAGDMVINHDLIGRGYELPKGGMFDPLLKRDEITEEVYDRLPDPPKGGGCDWGMVMKPKVQEDDGTWRDATPEECDQIRREVLKAGMKARKEGKMPAEWEAILKQMFRSKMDWRDVLRKFLGGGELREPTWARPNRRYIHDDIYLPGGGKFGPGQIGLFVDTSGSIQDDLLAKFICEVNKVNEDLLPEVVHVVACDAKVQWTEDFGPYDDVTCKPVGRGGTSFKPPFDYATARGWPLKAAVYFTDLECSSYPTKPDFPVLWVVWPGGRGANPPFGQVIRMD